MKNLKHATATILVLISISVFGQQTINELTSNAVQADVKTNAIYDLDVFHYFELTDYDTELKRAVFKKTKEYLYIAAVDCTGHGIPGAFMSMIGSDRLNIILFCN